MKINKSDQSPAIANVSRRKFIQGGLATIGLFGLTACAERVSPSVMRQEPNTTTVPSNSLVEETLTTTSTTLATQDMTAYEAPQSTATTELSEGTSTTEAPEEIARAEDYGNGEVFADGQYLGLLSIPSINLQTSIFAVRMDIDEYTRFSNGESSVPAQAMLDIFDTEGPGHWPGTKYPGQLGNSVFGAHNMTSGNTDNHNVPDGGPFRHLDMLMSARTRQKLTGDLNARGDTFAITQLNGTVLEYEVVTDGLPNGDDNMLRNVNGMTEEAVAEATYEAIINSRGSSPDKSTLTLYTCHPDWTSDERLVVVAELISPAPVS